MLRHPNPEIPDTSRAVRQSHRKPTCADMKAKNFGEPGASDCNCLRAVCAPRTALLLCRPTYTLALEEDGVLSQLSPLQEGLPWGADLHVATGKQPDLEQP